MGNTEKLYASSMGITAQKKRIAYTGTDDSVIELLTRMKLAAFAVIECEKLCAVILRCSYLCVYVLRSDIRR